MKRISHKEVKQTTFVTYEYQCEICGEKYNYDYKAQNCERQCKENNCEHDYQQHEFCFDYDRNDELVGAILCRSCANCNRVEERKVGIDEAKEIFKSISDHLKEKIGHKFK